MCVTGMNLIILKIGGSVITEKGSISRAREAEIERISHEIAAFRKDSDSQIILVHGAGSFGHPQAMKYRLTEGFDAYGTYLTHDSVKLLNTRVVESLNNASVCAMPVHPLSSCLLDNGKLIDFQLGHIKVMLEKGIVPVLHGDVVMDITKGASVLSGDRIVQYLAIFLEASNVGAGCDVDGVLDEEENVIRKITQALRVQDAQTLLEECLVRYRNCWNLQPKVLIHGFSMPRERAWCQDFYMEKM